MNKKNKEYKKEIKFLEDTLLKKDEKTKMLEMYKKNSELTSQVTGNEFEQFENYGAGNLLDANMGIEDIEPEF